jgi:hypothetical protein
LKKLWMSKPPDIVESDGGTCEEKDKQRLHTMAYVRGENCIVQLKSWSKNIRTESLTSLLKAFPVRYLQAQRQLRMSVC